jgi:hypothetical protein
LAQNASGRKKWSAPLPSRFSLLASPEARAVADAVVLDLQAAALPASVESWRCSRFLSNTTPEAMNPSLCENAVPRFH